MQDYKRWNEVGLIMKSIRWLRYRPYYMILSLRDYGNWLLAGCPNVEPRIFKSRWQVFKHIWFSNLCRAQFFMGAYLTGEEYLAEIRNRDTLRRP